MKTSSLLPADCRHGERCRSSRTELLPGPVNYCLSMGAGRGREDRPDRLHGRWRRRGKPGGLVLLTVLCLVLSACAYSRSVLPEGVGLLSSSAVQEPDSLSSQHSPEMTSQPADLSISDFSPSVLSGEVGGQAECALSVLPVGLDREQLILINDNPDVVQIAELSFAEEGAGMVLRLRLAFVGEGKAQITVQSADGKSCSNTLQLEIGGREDSMMVFITPSGGKYHCSASCGGKNAFEVPLSQAIQEGYTPCKRCAGQQMSSLPVTGGRAEAQPAG